MKRTRLLSTALLGSSALLIACTADPQPSYISGSSLTYADVARAAQLAEQQSARESAPQPTFTTASSPPPISAGTHEWPQAPVMDSDRASIEDSVTPPPSADAQRPFALAAITDGQATEKSPQRDKNSIGSDDKSPDVSITGSNSGLTVVQARRFIAENLPVASTFSGNAQHTMATGQVNEVSVNNSCMLSDLDSFKIKLKCVRRTGENSARADGASLTKIMERTVDVEAHLKDLNSEVSVVPVPKLKVVAEPLVTINLYCATGASCWSGKVHAKVSVQDTDQPMESNSGEKEMTADHFEVTLKEGLLVARLQNAFATAIRLGGGRSVKEAF